MNNANLIVYPFDEEFIPILRHKDLFKNITINRLISPAGWGYSGKDAGTIDNGSPVGIIVENDFESALQDCDTVIICESKIKIDYENIIKPNITMAIKKKKNIICLLKLTNLQEEELKNKCIDEGVSFLYFDNKYKISDFDEITSNNGLYPINTPVVFVMGTMEYTNKFEIQLSLKEEFSKAGYSVSCIGSRSYSGFADMECIPEFMFKEDIDEYNKILLFNLFVKQIEEIDKPDIIIIGIPGGVLPVNNTITNRFGLLHYEISRAVIPDSTVLCRNYCEFDKKNFIDLAQLIKYRFSSNIECFYLNNNFIDFSDDDDSLSIVKLDNEIVNSEISKSLDSGLFITSNSKAVCKIIENSLSKYADLI